MSFRLSLYLRNVGVLVESSSGVITGREPTHLNPFQLEENFGVGHLLNAPTVTL